MADQSYRPLGLCDVAGLFAQVQGRLVSSIKRPGLQQIKS